MREALNNVRSIKWEGFESFENFVDDEVYEWRGIAVNDFLVRNS